MNLKQAAAALTSLNLKMRKSALKTKFAAWSGRWSGHRLGFLFLFFLLGQVQAQGYFCMACLVNPRELFDLSTTVLPSLP